MDLLCYEEINIISLKKIMNVIYAMNSFLKILNVKDANLYAALLASINFILRIIIIVQYTAIKLFDILI